jgi:hypothetical protein
MKYWKLIQQRNASTGSTTQVVIRMSWPRKRLVSIFCKYHFYIYYFSVPTIHIRKASARRVQMCVLPKGFHCPGMSASAQASVMEKPNWLSQMPGEDVPDNQPWTMDSTWITFWGTSSTLSRCRFSSHGWEPWCVSCSSIRVASLSQEVPE